MSALVPEPLRLRRSTVLVLHASLADVDDAAIARALPILSAAERDRAERIAHADERGRFVTGRLLLRRVGAGLSGVAAADVRIDIEDAGRPTLPGVAPRVWVSITHSGSHVLVAVARRPVGVDVEELPRVSPAPAVLDRVCSRRELRWLARLPADRRERAFLVIWTRKEAYGKAIGRGLDFSLRSVSVAPRGNVVRGAAGRWGVRRLNVAEDCVAAVAACDLRWWVRLMTVDPFIEAASFS